MLETVLDQISNALIDGKSVKLSSFGTFTPRQKRERIGRNPKTGVAATINARRVISFKPSKLMKERINKSEKIEHKFDTQKAPRAFRTISEVAEN